jgi:hypothetical protein
MDEEELETGVNETEPAEQPVEETPEAQEGEEEAETAEQPTETEEEPVQSAEDNARYANVRREAERQAQLKYQPMLEEYDSMAKELASGYVNPLTGQPITNARDYFAVLKAQRLQEQGIDPNVFTKEVENAVNNSPVVRQAAQIQGELKRQFQDQYITEAIKKVHEVDPNVNSIDDLAKVDANGAFPKLLGMGIDAKTAYMAINGDKLREQAVAAAKQKTINEARGKSHLQTTDGVNEQSTEQEIPQNQVSRWKLMFPDSTDKELRSKYNSYLKTQK